MTISPPAHIATVQARKPGLHRPAERSPARRLLPALLAGLMGFGLTAAVQAADEPIEWGTPGLKLDPRAELEIETLRNRQLRRDDVRTNDEISPALQLGALWQINRRWSLFTDVEAVYEYDHETGNGSDTKLRLKLNQFYGTAVIPEAQALVKLGRWKMKDERAWLFDEELDGVTARFDRGLWRLDAMIAKFNHFGRDLFHYSDTKGDDSRYYAVMGTYALDKRHDLVLRALRQDSSDADIQLNHLSIASIDMPRQGMQHWAMLSLVTGSEGGTSVRGQAIDLGATWILDREYKPRLTAGYAWGSGDDGEGRDTAHRQTGLNDNEARMGGSLVDIPVYGHTLNPDLRNMHILTLGAGASPTDDMSVDLLYHHYRQDKLGSLTDTRMRPRGDTEEGRSLGHGLDLVVGWRPASAWRIKAIAGYFKPADRFRDGRGSNAPSASSAYSGLVEIKYYFNR